jgi:hypothetical protein
MKKLLATTLAGGLLATVAYGQGTVQLLNYFGSPTTDPAVLLYGGAGKVTGTQYVAGLSAGPASGGEVEVAGVTAPFYTQAAAAGFFNGPVVSIPNVAGGATAFMKVLVWDTTLNGTTTGATWAQAQAYSLAQNLPNVAGWSAEFSEITGNPSATPPGLPTKFNVGPDPLKSFQMGIPEPSTFALAGLGAAALMIFRRRK